MKDKLIQFCFSLSFALFLIFAVGFDTACNAIVDGKDFDEFIIIVIIVTVVIYALVSSGTRENATGEAELNKWKKDHRYGIPPKEMVEKAEYKRYLWDQGVRSELELEERWKKYLAEKQGPKKTRHKQQ